MGIKITGQAKRVIARIDEAVEQLTGRGNKPIGQPSETVFNGPNSLFRNLFESSNNTAHWSNIVMNKGEEGKEWRLSGGRLAGAFVGASAFGRLASGGGIYKDADGNTDIIGIPFI